MITGTEESPLMEMETKRSLRSTPARIKRELVESINENNNMDDNENYRCNVDNQNQLVEETSDVDVLNEIREIREAIVAKAVEGAMKEEKIDRLETRKRREAWSSDSAVNVAKKYCPDPYIERARQALLMRFSVRQMREFICDTEGLPRPALPSGSLPVRRQQRERREIIDSCRSTKVDTEFKLKFPFLTIQVGDFQSYLPLDYLTHPQQRDRSNSLTINGSLQRMIYEFTLYDKDLNMCYAVWTLALSSIAAMHFSNDLVYFRLTTPPSQVVSFIGGKSDPAYDMTDGQRQNSLLHYFRLKDSSQELLDGLMRCDPSHFGAIIMDYDEFFKTASEMVGDEQLIGRESGDSQRSLPISEVEGPCSSAFPQVPVPFQSGARESLSFKELLRYASTSFSKIFEGSSQSSLVGMDNFTSLSVTKGPEAFKNFATCLSPPKSPCPMSAVKEALEMVDDEYVIVDSEVYQVEVEDYSLVDE